MKKYNFNLYNNKTNIIYICKIVYSRPNGLTDWSENFFWTLMGGRGTLQLVINKAHVIMN